jgi:exoribonuclease-2
MERFWTLRYIEQEGMTEIVGTLFKEGLVRADHVPLVLPVLGGNDLPRGAHVRVKLGEIDPITLDVKGTVIERLDVPAEAVDETLDEGEEETVAGPIAIAVDVNETEDSSAATSDNPGS